MENEQVVNQQNGQVQQEAAVQQAPAQQQAQQVVEQPKEEPKKENFFKKHWKGLTFGGVGLAATVTSAIAAYKRGKAAGIASVPQQQEDYSLNPNIE